MADKSQDSSRSAGDSQPNSQIVRQSNPDGAVPPKPAGHSSTTGRNPGPPPGAPMPPPASQAKSPPQVQQPQQKPSPGNQPPQVQQPSRTASSGNPPIQQPGKSYPQAGGQPGGQQNPPAPTPIRGGVPPTQTAGQRGPQPGSPGTPPAGSSPPLSAGQNFPAGGQVRPSPPASTSPYSSHIAQNIGQPQRSGQPPAYQPPSPQSAGMPPAQPEVIIVQVPLIAKALSLRLQRQQQKKQGRRPPEPKVLPLPQIQMAPPPITPATAQSAPPVVQPAPSAVTPVQPSPQVMARPGPVTAPQMVVPETTRDAARDQQGRSERKMRIKRSSASAGQPGGPDHSSSSPDAGSISPVGRFRAVLTVALILLSLLLLVLLLGTTLPGLDSKSRVTLGLLFVILCIMLITLLLLSLSRLAEDESGTRWYEERYRYMKEELEQMKARERELQAKMSADSDFVEPQEPPLVKRPEINLPVVRSSNQNVTQPLALPVDESPRPEPEPQSKEMARNPADPPEYDARDYPHEKYYPRNGTSESLGFGWRIIGASRRGYGHYNGKYREDDFAIRLFPVSKRRQVALAAIADGVSSKKYSRLGARSAVEGVINTPRIEQYLEKLMACFARSYHSNGESADAAWQLFREATTDAAWEVFLNALYAATINLHECAEKNKERLSQDDLHSTLMIFLGVPINEQQFFIAAHQIGDGVLFKMQEAARPEDRWGWLLQAQIQASGNEVQPFLRADPETWRDSFHWEVLPDGRGRCILGMTDGIADDIEPPRDPQAGGPFAPVEAFYREHVLSACADPSPARRLLDEIGYHKRQSFDDRTLICLYRE